MSVNTPRITPSFPATPQAPRKHWASAHISTRYPHPLTPAIFTLGSYLGAGAQNWASFHHLSTAYLSARPNYFHFSQKYFSGRLRLPSHRHGLSVGDKKPGRCARFLGSALASCQASASVVLLVQTGWSGVRLGSTSSAKSALRLHACKKLGE